MTRPEPPGRYVWLHALSLTLYITWAALLLRFEIYPALAAPILLLLPLALAGFFAAALLHRFLPRRALPPLNILSLLLLAGLTVLLSLTRLPQAPLAACAFALLAGLSFLCFPLLSAPSESARSVFNAVLLLLTPSAGLTIAALRVSELPALFPMLAALTALAAAFGAGWPALKTPRPEIPSDGALSPRQGRLWFVLYCVVAYLACAVVAAEISRKLSVPGLDGPLSLGAALFLFALMQPVSYFLIRAGRHWQLSYIIFTAFSLAVLLILLNGGHIIFSALPLMLLILSLSGMLHIFFVFAQSLLAPINHPLVNGIVYCLLFPILFLLLLSPSSGPLGFALSNQAVQVAAAAAVLLLAPLFLRAFDQYPPAAAADLPGGDKTARPAAEESPPSDFELLLTAAERRVYELILLGYSNQQIADEIFISINTVKFHVRNILSKSGMQRKSQLVSYYLQKK